VTGRGGVSLEKGRLTGAVDRGHLTGVNDLPSAWRSGRASDYSN